MNGLETASQPANGTVSSLEPLFKPFAMPELSLRNRIVMAPMTRYFSPGGIPGPEVASYYARRAATIGLVISEGCFVPHPSSGYHPSVPRFYGAEALAGWSRIIQEVHAVGGKMMPQLWHVGVQSQIGDIPDPSHPPLSASGYLNPHEKIGEPMTVAEIEAVIAAFGEGAATARQLGFDGIELHGAHGYLLDSFLWDGTNHRTDSFGGDAANRALFPALIVQECRRRAGSNFPIVYRFSQWKTGMKSNFQDSMYNARLADDPISLAALLEPLADAGVDMFHCSTRRFWVPEFGGSPLNLAGWTKHLTGKPVITVGSIGLSNDMFESFEDTATTRVTSNFGRLIEMLECGETDLVAVGRGLIADPEWARKIREGRLEELVEFHRDFLNTIA